MTALTALITCEVLQHGVHQKHKKAFKIQTTFKLSSQVSSDSLCLLILRNQFLLLRPACSQAWHTVLSQSLLATQAHTPTAFLHYEPEGRVRYWMR